MTQTLLIEEFVTTGLGWKQKNCSAKNSQKNYRNHLKQFEIFLAKREKTIHTVENEDIEQYIAELKRLGYQPNTIAVKVSSVSSYFKWMKHKGTITHIPFIKQQPHFFGVHKKVPDQALDAVFGSISGDSLKETRDTAMISLIAYLGLKTEAVVALNMEDIDLLQKTVKGKPAKSVHRQLQKYIWAREKNGIPTDPDAPLFVNKHKNRISGRSLRRHLCKCFADVKSPVYSTRDLQHTYKCKNPKPKGIVQV